MTPLLYLPDGGSYVLVGSAGGAQKEPAWVENVAAMAEVTIEVGAHTLLTKPVLLRDGPERPDLLEYQTRTDRSFPLIRLDPTA